MKKKTKAIDLLADFIERHRHKTHSFGTNEWLNGDDMAVYVRKSVPRIMNDGTKLVTLDIASITVYQKGQGNFTRFLEEAEKLNPWPATYIENVLEPRFARFFQRIGYTQHNDMFPMSFYKLKEEQNVRLPKELVRVEEA